MIKAKVTFLEGRLFSSHQGFLKTFQIALISWIKAGPPKKPLLFLSQIDTVFLLYSKNLFVRRLEIYQVSR